MGSATAEAPRKSGPSHRYRLFGLLFETTEPIPWLAEAEDGGDTGAIRVRFGPVPRAIKKPDYQDKSVQASATEYLFSYPGALRLYVKGDSEIVVERLEACPLVRLWTLVLSVGASVVGFRHGLMPLHASLLAACGGGVALAGQEGFGKSTLAASLVNLGFALHADDLCLVQPGNLGPPWAGTGVPEIRLWEDAVKTLGWAGRTGAIPIPGTSKTVYRVAAGSPSRLPLKRIYALQFANEETPAGIHRIAGVTAMQTLIGCLRMRTGLLSVGTRQKTFESLAAISSNVEVYRFARPLDRTRLLEWSERLADHLSA